MTTSAHGDDSGTRGQGDHPHGQSSQDVPEMIPEWAPLEPLPSSTMFLAAFDGKRLATATDILDPAFDLRA